MAPTTNREQRNFKLGEIRMIEEGGKKHIRGYAIVFDSPSGDLGGFKETVNRSALTKTTKESDVRMLWNHDSSKPLASTKNGTLSLTIDERGLAVDAVGSDTSWGKDAVTAISEGLVDQMSFGFRTIKDRWFEENGETRRELLEIELFDVSPVTFPAYEQTSVGVRSIDGLDTVLLKAEKNIALSRSDVELVKNTVNNLNGLLTNAEPVQADHSTDQAVNPNDLLREKLDLMEKV